MISCGMAHERFTLYESAKPNLNLLQDTHRCSRAGTRRTRGFLESGSKRSRGATLALQSETVGASVQVFNSRLHVVFEAETGLRTTSHSEGLEVVAMVRPLAMKEDLVEPAQLTWTTPIDR